MRRSRKFWHVAAFTAVFAAAIAVVMLLWNAIIPGVIGWSAITYWQAAGLVVLCKLLFGRFGHGRGGFCRGHHRGHAHLREELKGMSREERCNYIRQRMANFDHFYDKKRSSQNTTEE